MGRGATLAVYTYPAVAAAALKALTTGNGGYFYCGVVATWMCMASKFECPNCGQVWVKKSGLLGTKRKGYDKVSENQGRCSNCGHVQVF